MELAANGLQVDSHLPAVHYPVVCNSQPALPQHDARGRARPPFLCTLEVAPSTPTTNACMLTLTAIPRTSLRHVIASRSCCDVYMSICNTQVATVLGDGEAPPLALDNTWVRRAQVALPLLALAADDALLAFGEALQRTLQTAESAGDRWESHREAAGSLLNNGRQPASVQPVLGGAALRLPRVEAELHVAWLHSHGAAKLAAAAAAAADDQGVRAELHGDALISAANRCTQSMCISSAACSSQTCYCPD